MLTRNTGSDKAFVRTAKAQGWKSELAAESAAAIESAWGKLIEQLGYELMSSCKRERVEENLTSGNAVSDEFLEPRALKDVVRKFIPQFLLEQRGIIRRLGPRAGRIYAGLQVRSLLGMQDKNQLGVPPSTRSFVFVCFGNIMRSAMAEFLMRKVLDETGSADMEKIRIASGGLHAIAGREAHPWAQEAAAELGVSLAMHHAKLLTREMVDQGEAIFAMDFQNKAELLALYPDAAHKIYMLGAYAEGGSKWGEIPDPYLGDLEVTCDCARQLRTCVQNLLAATVLSSAKPAAARAL